VTVNKIIIIDVIILLLYLCICDNDEKQNTINLFGKEAKEEKAKKKN
jgi:hypothetical protein